MDKDTFLSKITEIGTISDDVERRKLLSEISDGVSTVYEDIDTLNSSIETFKSDLSIMKLLIK